METKVAAAHTPCMCTDCRTQRALTTERQLEPTSEQQTIAELLETLELFIEWADDGIQQGNGCPVPEARAAIAKARAEG